MNKHAKVNNFDLLRVILSVLVALAHFNMLSGLNSDFFIFKLSGVSVDAFFVVSGFLVSWSFASDNNLLRYSIKRVFRIYPLYFSVIILQLISLVFLNKGNVDFFEYVSYFFYNLFFLNFLSPTVGDVLLGLNGHNAINGSLWTLKIEVGFYCILPFMLLFFSGRFIYFALMYVLSCAFFMISLYYFKGLSEQLPSQLRFFVVGMVMFFWGHNFFKVRFKYFRFLLLFFTVVLLFFCDNFLFFDVFFYPILVGVFVYSVVFFFVKIPVRIELSYPVYIVHFPIIQLMLYFGLDDYGYTMLFFMFVFFVFIISLLLHYIIELPFMGLGRNMLRKKND